MLRSDHVEALPCLKRVLLYLRHMPCCVIRCMSMVLWWDQQLLSREGRQFFPQRRLFRRCTLCDVVTSDWLHAGKIIGRDLDARTKNPLFRSPNVALARMLMMLQYDTHSPSTTTLHHSYFIISLLPCLDLSTKWCLNRAAEPLLQKNIISAMCE